MNRSLRCFHVAFYSHFQLVTTLLSVSALHTNFDGDRRTVIGIASSHFSFSFTATMKFSALAALSLLVGPAAAEIYLKEDFNDEVRRDGSV